MKANISKAADFKVIWSDIWFGGSTKDGGVIIFGTTFPWPEVMSQPTDKTPPQLGVQELRMEMQFGVRLSIEGWHKFADWINMHIKNMDSKAGVKNDVTKSSYVG